MTFKSSHSNAQVNEELVSRVTGVVPGNAVTFDSDGKMIDTGLQFGAAATKLGSLITFDKPATYNSPTAPSAGTITYDLTNAAAVTEVIGYFNHPVMPVFPNGSYPVGTWNNGGLNIVRFQYVGAGNVSIQIFSNLGTTNNTDTRFSFIRLTTDSSTTGTTAVDITDAVIPMQSNSVYRVECEIGYVNSGGGTRFGALAPSNWKIAHMREGSTTSPSASLIVSSVDNTSFYSGQAWGAYVPVAPTSPTYKFSANITTNATAGDFKLQFGSFIAAQLSTILSDRCFIRVTKLS